MTIPMQSNFHVEQPADAMVPVASVTEAVSERRRCIMILQQRARAFERLNLFNVSRALSSVAEEIRGSDDDESVREWDERRQTPVFVK
ncbi:MULTISPECIES: hypothetical protein [unclassified Mesorhizobium]|uniref:hypothetical protein n=1 Tax=unclassified Mesorhizobium TaxID=325217 RepID=UPI000FCA83A8|nr:MULTISPECIES: hypothetical protein [unclassified Mesorhizobium]RUW78596.1 hypothetical protein EOA31_00815 [Mesorhizobium sp. M4B.F.Ca.ET.049.02.1.2]RVD17826.1 hypothetical protein EN738_28185 [Mesorhizobium sp. M4B.F.Ca.ET.017.02.2.1]RWA66553.1 MAG: hypothetical protein EOQ27_01755 [Mesorhizobium sp.]TGV22807.1 hypothetical protein EN786_27145 [Mesorhizobium sp. M4B.F.Ca.ET.143.01.1.1]TIX19133.1 MAG: hypothetical protein E5V41_03120 [Mesorhizobium sp.]